MWIFLIFSLVPALVSADRDCRAEPSKGLESPGKTPEIRYFYDPEHSACYPFKYLGSGGNGNNFEDKHECEYCIPADSNSCGFNIKSTGSCSNSPPGSFTDCPKGSECHRGAFFGICCPKDKLERADWPKCAPGKVVFQNFKGYRVISKSCALDFCPKNTECVDGEFYAHCCQEDHTNLRAYQSLYS